MFLKPALFSVTPPTSCSTPPLSASSPLFPDEHVYKTFPAEQAVITHYMMMYYSFLCVIIIYDTKHKAYKKN